MYGNSFLDFIRQTIALTVFLGDGGAGDAWQAPGTGRRPRSTTSMVTPSSSPDSRGRKSRHPFRGS